MRLPIISPDKLTDEQKTLAADMKEGIAKSFQGFVNIRGDGALLGPWNPWLHEPKFGKPVWELTKAMAFNPSLPPAVREIAILVTGAHFKAAYEIYAHVIAAERKGLSDEKLATIVAGQRPVDLTKQEAVAYDFAGAGLRRRLAGTNLQGRGGAVRDARSSRIIISHRSLLYGVRYAQHVRCA